MSIVKRISDSYSIVGTDGNTIVSIGNPTLNNAQFTINAVGINVGGAGTAFDSNIDAVIDSFSSSIYQSAKYIVSISNNPDYQISEILVIQDGVNANCVVYGNAVIPSNPPFVTFSANIVTGNISLWANSSIGTTNISKLQATYIPV